MDEKTRELEKKVVAGDLSSYAEWALNKWCRTGIHLFSAESRVDLDWHSFNKAVGGNGYEKLFLSKFNYPTFFTKQCFFCKETKNRIIIYKTSVVEGKVSQQTEEMQF